MKKELFELTNPQKAIWLTEQYYTGTNVNNVCGVLTIKIKLDIDIFKKAINKFVETNDSYRIKLNFDNNVIKQYIEDYCFSDIPVINVTSDNDVNDLEQKIANIPFTILDSTLFSFTLFKFPDGHGGFVINTHHIISDSWSLGITVNKIITIYSSLIDNEIINQNDCENFSYINYINSDKVYFNSNKFGKDKEYWNTLFSSIPEVTTLPSVVKSSDIELSLLAKRNIFSINADLLLKIRSFCSNANISIFTFFMGIYSLYIGRLCNLNDFVIGTPILNRGTYNEKNTTGMFINTLPLRITLESELLFRDFLNKISLQFMSLLRHQKYSYQNIIEDIRKKDTSIPTLYNIILSYQITKVTQKSEIIPHESTWTFNSNIADDIDIHIFDLNDVGSLNIAYDYKTSKYSELDIFNLHNRAIHMIEQVLSNLDIRLNNINVLLSKESKQIVSEFNNTTTNFPKNSTIIELFNEQVRISPDNIAIVFENQQLTYKELNQKVNQLAHHLSSCGIGYNDIVCLLMDKSLEVVISILAILKCNAIYLPIDIDYPPERIEYILSNSNSKLIITNSQFINKYHFNVPMLAVELDNVTIFDEKYSNDTIPLLKTCDDLAYIMYTSGSTGMPKGTMIKEKAVIRLVKNTNYITITACDKIIQTGSIVFDACTFEIWGSFLNGATLYMLKKEALLNNNKLDQFLTYNHISIMFITTALFNQLCEIKPTIFNSLTYLLTGGEAVSIKHMNIARKENPSLKLVHVYGPTENTTFSTYYNVEDLCDCVPIGKPIGNSTCYVVSTISDNLQPIGIPGELWVGGDGVGKGYLNRSDLSSKQFINNPFDTGTLYKTGDLVKWMPDGNIDFIGRIDNQIKIRGFRIELSEIDSKILTYPSIKQSITLSQNILDKQYICSYVVANNEIEITSLKNYLKNSLPSYMIPNFIQLLPKLPMNINGKIDRKQLPIPSTESTVSVVKPTNYIEQELFDIIANHLGKFDISITDDFIEDLGLDSLCIMSICTKLSKYNVDIQDINNNCSIEKLAHKIQGTASEDYSKNVFETVSIENKTVNFDLSNILLTGSIGFLGSHILKELILNKSVTTIYCLIREKNKLTTYDRLKNIINFYFDANITTLCNKKVKIVNGDFEKDTFGLSSENYKDLASIITTVIHCGANVSHYGNYNKFYTTNVIGTKNIINFCKNSNSNLAHISTLSVGGYSHIHDIKTLDEDSLNINQLFKNHVYMITKYKAECEVLKSFSSNFISGKIFRLGNIMPRYEDGVFQKNSHDNAFISRIDTILKTNCITDELKNVKIDISPVDYCAKSIITLLNAQNAQTIYHIYNNNTINISSLLETLNMAPKTVSNTFFIQQIKSLNSPLHAHLLNDLLNTSVVESQVVNIKTVSILKDLDFSWNKLNFNYLNSIIKNIGDYVL